MKNINIIIISFFIAINLFSQTFQPKQQKLIYLTDTIYLDTHQDFKQSKFELGWHWHTGRYSKNNSGNDSKIFLFLQ